MLACALGLRRFGSALGLLLAARFFCSVLLLGLRQRLLTLCRAAPIASPAAATIARTGIAGRGTAPSAPAPSAPAPSPVSAATALFASVRIILVGWWIANPLDRFAEHLLDIFERLEFFGCHQRGREAFFARAARAPNAVHVVIRLPGKVEIEYVADVGDVEPARGHIACR